MTYDEETIGVAGTSNEYYVVGAQHHRFQCTSCKRNVHCIAGWKNQGDPVKMLKDRCGKDCECKCRTHYLAKNGKLKPYGTVDGTSSLDGINLRSERNESDDFIDELNAWFVSSRSESKVVKKKNG